MTVLQPSLENGCEVWNTDECQSKALKLIQLCACKYILRCSVATCDDPVHAGLGLVNLKPKAVFCELKWYDKVMFMNDKGYQVSYYIMSTIR